jgi:hypothetical protein
MIRFASKPNRYPNGCIFSSVRAVSGNASDIPQHDIQIATWLLSGLLVLFGATCFGEPTGIDKCEMCICDTILVLPNTGITFHRFEPRSSRQDYSYRLH